MPPGPACFLGFPWTFFPSEPGKHHSPRPIQVNFPQYSQTHASIAGTWPQPLLPRATYPFSCCNTSGGEVSGIQLRENIHILLETGVFLQGFNSQPCILKVSPQHLPALLLYDSRVLDYVFKALYLYWYTPSRRTHLFCYKNSCHFGKRVS